MSRNHWEIGGNSRKIGEFRENFGENWWNSGVIGGKLVNCVSQMVKQNSQTVKSISFGNLCETGGGNERVFVFTTNFNCTVLYVLAQWAMYFANQVLVYVLWPLKIFSVNHQMLVWDIKKRILWSQLIEGHLRSYKVISYKSCPHTMQQI